MVSASLPHAFPLTFKDALRTALAILSSNPKIAGSSALNAEAEVLVCAAYRRETARELSRMELYSRAPEEFPSGAAVHLLKMAEERASGRLLQHVTGFQAFYNHEYMVSPEVLIPRPETEFLVQAAIESIGTALPLLGFELGIGSGAISVELLSHFPGLSMVASELMPLAAKIARQNADRILGKEASSARLKIVSSGSSVEVWEPFESVADPEKRADFFISNPPYLARGSREGEVEPDVARYEPSSALYAPESDVEYFYREIAAKAAGHLVPGAWVFLEIPHERGENILRHFEPGKLGQFERAELRKDLTGRNRVLIARLSGDRAKQS